jgi:hypothetical protein
VTLTIVIYVLLVTAAIALTVYARRLRRDEHQHPPARPSSLIRIVGHGERPFDWETDS